jgi:hypothetical protein
LARGVSDEIDPPRKTYGFKEREFQRDNRPASGSQPPISAQDLAKQAGPVARTVPVPSNAPKPGDANDVFAALDKNRTVEKSAGGDTIAVRQVSSRRTRDYWLALTGGNIVIAGGALFFGGVALIFGLAGIIIYSLGLTWVMWQVMNRY